MLIKTYLYSNINNTTMKSGVLKSSWTLVGSIVGAGIIGLPFVMQKAGFLTGILVMIIICLLMTLINLYLAEIVTSTKEKHQLTGYAEKYLGKKGKWIMFIANISSLYGALVAYIIGAGYAISAIFPGESFFYSIIFFVFVSIIIYFGINIISNVEYIFSPIKLVVALLLGISLLSVIKSSNILVFDIENILIPYGVIVFGFTGVSAIPLMNEELKNKNNLIKSIIWGMVISFIIYFIFSLGVVGALGNNVNEVATVSLKEFGSFVNIIANLFALLAMGTAFLALGFALKENFLLDIKLKNRTAWFATITIPLIIFVTGITGFIKILEFTGAIAIAIILILIILMHNKINKLRNRIPEFHMPQSLLLKGVIVIILLGGIFYELISLL